MLSSFQGRFAFGKAALNAISGPPSGALVLLGPPNGVDNLAIMSDLYTHLNGTDGYPSDYGRVGWWRDDSGNNNHARDTSSGVQGRRPELRTGVMTVDGNLVDAVRFGSDIDPPYVAALEFTEGSYFSPSNLYLGFNSGQAGTLCFDFQLTELPGSGTEFMAMTILVSNSGGNYYVTDVYASNYSGYTSLCWRFANLASSSSAGVGYAATLDTNRHRLIITFDGVDSSSASSYTVRLDGVNVTPVATGNFSTGATRAAIGASPASNYGNFRGYMRSFTAYERVLTTAECEQWEEWAGPNLYRTKQCQYYQLTYQIQLNHHLCRWK